MSKRNKNVLFAAVSIMMIVSIVLLYNGLFKSNKTLSHDGQYSASYNILTKTITTKNLISGETSHLVCGDNPAFLWSPDSKRLAVTTDNEYGTRWSHVIYFEQHQGIVLPDESEIRTFNNEIEKPNENNHDVTIIVTEWLDDTHVLMKYSWLSDTSGETISGWFTYDLSGRIIEDFQA